jgi:hypothetical protein
LLEKASKRQGSRAGPAAARRHLLPARICQGKMINLHEFRAGQYSVPFSCGDEIPECCFACVYLLYDDTDACLCESQLYFCGYAWPDKLTHTVPPCLLDPR